MDDNAQLLEIYKLHVEMTDRISQRRGLINQFYISLLSGLLLILAFVVDKNINQYSSFLFIIIGLVGTLVCVLWSFTVASYRKLNSAKFKVLHDIEHKLTFDFYNKEYNEIKSLKNYNFLTSVEKVIPIVLSIPFVFLFIYGIVARFIV